MDCGLFYKKKKMAQNDYKRNYNSDASGSEFGR